MEKNALVPRMYDDRSTPDRASPRNVSAPPPP